MQKVILQVPMSKKLRDSAAKSAKEMGFSSLQEVVRFLAKEIASGRVDVFFEGKRVHTKR